MARRSGSSSAIGARNGRGARGRLRMHGRAPVRWRAAPPEVRACVRRLECARRSFGPPPRPAAQTAQRLIAARLADYASAPRGGYQGSTTARTVLNRTRTVSGWRPRPDTVATRPDTVATRPEGFAACGFSDLRAGFVLRDESSRRERSRALHGSGRAAPEHGAGSPAPGTRPQPLGVLCTRNWARISEEPDASVVRGAGRLASDRGFEHV